MHWDTLGLTLLERKAVVLFQGLVNHDPMTIIHELVHVAHPRLSHGKKFDRLVRQHYLKAKKEFKWLNLK